MNFTIEEMGNGHLRCLRLRNTIREALAEDGRSAPPAGMSEESIGRMYADYYTSRPKQLQLDLQRLVNDGKIMRRVRYYA